VYVFEDICLSYVLVSLLSLLNYLISDNIPQFLYGRKEANFAHMWCVKYIYICFLVCICFCVCTILSSN